MAFTRDVLSQLGRSECVDPARVYATGKSNGGGFVNLLACQLPTRIAAIAPIAAAIYPGTASGCDRAPSRPVLAMHGTADVTIPFAGDAQRGLPGISTWVAGLARKAHCRPQARTSALADDVTKTSYRGCPRRVDVALVAVRGGGHTWPGADAYSGGGYTTQSVEATDLAWQFFKDHRTTSTGRSAS